MLGAESGSPLMVMWLLLWAPVGVPWIFALANAFAGREVILIDATELRAIREVWRFRFADRTYRVQLIDDLHYDPPVNRDYWAKMVDEINEVMGRGEGRMTFDYGGATCRFGIGLGEDESRWLVPEISSALTHVPVSRP